MKEWNPKNAVWGQTPITKLLAEKLTELEIFPGTGEVPDKKNNPSLEKFRRAQNVVYDIFNNGLCNRAYECRFALNGLKKSNLNLPEWWGSTYYEGQWDQVNEEVEKKFTPIVMEAAKEQGLI